MTLKSLFSKTFWVRLSRRLSQFNWLTALWSIVLFFVFPVAGALVFSMETRENYWTIARVSRVLLVQLGFACSFSVLMGILTPNAFNYLNSRRELDFYHSQPVTRKELFWRNYIVGWLSYIIPLTAGLILEAGIIMLIPGIAWENVVLMCKGFFACLGTYFSVNALCLLAVVLCGNRFISLLTGIYFCGAPAMLFGMFYYFVELFSATFRYQDLFQEILIGSSPLCYIFNLIVSHTAEVNDAYLWSVLGWTAVSVGVLFLARGLYLRRKSETAGKPLSFPRSILFIKYPLTVAAAWIGGLLFDAMTNSAVWMLFGAITFGILTHCIISGLEKFEFRNAFRGWLKLLLCTGIFLTCLLMTFIGCHLFDKRTTKDENIRSFDVYRITYREQSNGGTYYTMSTNLEGVAGEDAIKALNVLAKAGASDGFGVNTGGAGGSVWANDYSYAPDENSAYVSFYVRINTVFGSYTREYNYYCDSNSEVGEAVKDFAYSAGAKKAYAEYLLESIDTKADKFSFRANTDFPSREKMEEVYKALKEDMKNASLEDYEKAPLGYVMVSYSGRFYSWNSSSELASVNIPVYECYKKTLALAEDCLLPYDYEQYVGTFEKNENYSDYDYDKGFSIGYEEGKERGKQNGADGADYYEYSTSYNDSYSLGYAEGYRLGYDEGYNIYGNSYSEGYDVGYAEGKTAGENDAADGYDATLPEFIYNGTEYRSGYIDGFQTGYYDGYKNYSDANSTEPLE